jgi:SAM-dependent methyltransferase
VAAKTAPDWLRWNAGRVYGRVERILTRLVFQHRYGLPREAAGHIELDEVGFSGEGRQGYGPSPWGVLRRVLPPGEVTRDDVFLDLGCGMGNVLLTAAGYQFRRVIGVEIVPRFAEIAREAVARNQSRLHCPDVEVVVADVVNYEIPDDVTVAYLANPFLGSLFDEVVANLIASVDRNPRRLRVVYVAPQEAARLERTGRVRFVRYGRRAIRRWAPAEYLRLYEITPG